MASGRCNVAVKKTGVVEEVRHGSSPGTSLQKLSKNLDFKRAGATPGGSPRASWQHRSSCSSTAHPSGRRPCAAAGRPHPSPPRHASGRSGRRRNNNRKCTEGARERTIAGVSSPLPPQQVPAPLVGHRSRCALQGRLMGALGRWRQL